MDFIVRKKPQWFTVFLVIATSISFQLGSAHSYYDSLVEADFIGHGLKFEASDLENLFADKQKNLEIAPRAIPTLCSPDLNSSEQFPFFYFQMPSSDQTPFTLRC